MKCAYVTGITQRRSCKGSVDPVTRVQTIRFINMKCHHNSRLLDHVLVLCQISLTSSCSDEVEHVKFPSDIEDAKQLGLVLSRYKDRYYAQVSWVKWLVLCYNIEPWTCVTSPPNSARRSWEGCSWRTSSCRPSPSPAPSSSPSSPVTSSILVSPFSW